MEPKVNIIYRNSINPSGIRHKFRIKETGEIVEKISPEKELEFKRGLWESLWALPDKDEETAQAG